MYVPNAFAATSLLAAILAAALWAAAGLGSTGVARTTLWPSDGSGTEFSARADRASLCVCFRRPIGFAELTPAEWNTWAESRGRLHREIHLMGFRYLRGPVAVFKAAGDVAEIERADHWLVLGVPAPLALAVLLAPPMWHFSRAVRRRETAVVPP